jgi:hypothetical protein
MLKLYSTEAVRNRITLTYRGYDLEDKATVQAKKRVDWVLLP